MRCLQAVVVLAELEEPVRRSGAPVADLDHELSVVGWESDRVLGLERQDRSFVERRVKTVLV